MKLKLIFALIFFTALNFSTTHIFAQKNTFKLSIGEQTSIAVNGTSTLHKWTAKASKYGIEPANLELDGNQVSTIENLYFYVDVKSLDGGRGATMNKKIVAAFKGEEHPMIEFRQTQPATVKAIQADGSFEILSKGTLTMAGESQTVEIEVKGQKTENGVVLKATEPIKMSDFKIDRPSAMFGQIVCGDDVTAEFELFYEKLN